MTTTNDTAFIPADGETIIYASHTVPEVRELPEADLRRFLLVAEGQVFSQQLVTATEDYLTRRLGNEGYNFAKVTGIPELDEEENTVSMKFFVDPGKRTYVRRISFKGNMKTADDVLRREMRQMEGAWFSQAAIDRSKVRMQRLTYFETVEVETPAVPGTDDQVDVIVTVSERPAGSFTVGLGYSQVQGLIASLSIQQDNFLGSGKRLGLGISHSSIISSLNISYDNPYWTDDGISRGFYLRYQEFDQGAANISTFTSSEWAVGVNFGVPITEDRVMALSEHGTVGRPHVARILVEVGAVDSVEAALIASRLVSHGLHADVAAGQPLGGLFPVLAAVHRFVDGAAWPSADIGKDVAAALEGGRYQPGTPMISEPGWLREGRNTVKDVHNYGLLDVTGVIRKSSNVGITKIALSLPGEDIWSLLSGLGFGVPTDSGFPGESAGLLVGYRNWNEIETATLAFGYGISVTPLQPV